MERSRLDGVQPAWTHNSPAGRNLHASPLPAQHPQGLSKEPQYFLSRGKGPTETFHPLVFSLPLLSCQLLLWPRGHAHIYPTELSHVTLRPKYAKYKILFL